MVAVPKVGAEDVSPLNSADGWLVVAPNPPNDPVVPNAVFCGCANPVAAGLLLNRFAWFPNLWS